MNKISMKVGACLLLLLSACSRAPIPDGSYIDASSSRTLTFSAINGSGSVSADTPSAIWFGKYKWLDENTVQVENDGFPFKMKFSLDRKELILTDHLRNSTKFVKSTAEQSAGGNASRPTP